MNTLYKAPDVRIIQIMLKDGSLLGLGDDGMIYYWDFKGKWFYQVEV